MRVQLPEDSGAIFEVWYTWLYYRKFATKGNGGGEEALNAEKTTLIRAYNF